jgi:hypothetical protein
MIQELGEGIDVIHGEAREALPDGQPSQTSRQSQSESKLKRRLASGR